MRDAPATTRPLAPRHHYTMLNTDEVAQVHRYRQGLVDDEKMRERLRWGLTYAGLGVVMLALVFAIVVLARA